MHVSVVLSNLQVDYPEVISRKADAVKHISQYHELVQMKHDKSQDSVVVRIENYTAFGCDITDVRKLETLARANGIDPGLPTLLVAECVLSYIEPRR